MKMATHLGICTEPGCNKEIERDLRLKGKRIVCFDCKQKDFKRYTQERNAHISALLKKFPFRDGLPS